MKGLKPVKSESVELAFDDEPQKAEPVLEAEPSTSMQEAKKKCVNCSYPLETGWLACPQCGASFGKAVPPQLLETGISTSSPQPLPQTVIGPPVIGPPVMPTVSLTATAVTHSPTQLTRVLVAVVLLFIGVPGLISGVAMAFSSPGADGVAKQEAYNQAAGIADDPIERDGNQKVAANDDAAGHTVGGVLVLFSAALCVPGVVLLVGKKT